MLTSDEAKPATASSEPASNVEQLGGPLDNLDSKTREELQARSLRQPLCARILFSGFARPPDLRGRAEMSNEPDIIALLLDVKRAIATAKMAEFERQAYRVGDLVSTGLLGPALAADVLLDAAVSNGLVSDQGDDTVQTLIARGFGRGVQP